MDWANYLLLRYLIANIGYTQTHTQMKLKLITPIKLGVVYWRGYSTNNKTKWIKQTSFMALLLACTIAFIPKVNAQSSSENLKVEYYQSIFPELNGKLKSIGNTKFEYYQTIFPETNGKIKSIGDAKVEYYQTIFPETNGKIKSIGDVKIEYYQSIFPELNGKIKLMGNAEVEYYQTIFPETNGKIKSITGSTGSSLFPSYSELYYFIQQANSGK